MNGQAVNGVYQPNSMFPSTQLEGNQPMFPPPNQPQFFSTPIVAQQGPLPPPHYPPEIQQQFDAFRRKFEEQELIISNLQAQVTELTIKNKEKVDEIIQMQINATGYPGWSEEEGIVDQETASNSIPRTRVTFSKKQREDKSDNQYAWIVQQNKKKNTQPKKEKSTPSHKLATKPPPVIIKVKEGETPVMKSLEGQFNYKAVRLNDQQIKVNVENEEDYRKLTYSLANQNCQYHSYENKQTRPIKVMARNLLPTFSEDEICEDIKGQGLKIREVNQKLRFVKTGSKVEEIKLPLFMLTFEPDEDFKKIYELKYILHMKISIESIKKNKLIPQCTRCQAFGHTQKYCMNKYKCVKCGNNHPTKDCTKPQTELPKCCNCLENHPANYRGCSVAKKLQQMRDKRAPIKPNNSNFNPQTKKQEMSKQPPASQGANKQPPTTHQNKNVSYAQAVKQPNIQHNPDPNIAVVLTQILGEISRMNNEIIALKSSKNPRLNA